MKILINRALEALLRVTSGDDTRPALQGISIMPKKGRSKYANAVATDGHILLTAPVRLTERGTLEEQLIPGAFLRRFFKLTTKRLRRDERARATVAEDDDLSAWIEVQAKKDSDGLVLAESCGSRLGEHWPHQGPFPNASLVWPKEGKSYQPYVLGVDMLKKLMAAAGELKGGQTGAEFITFWVPVAEVGDDGMRPATYTAALVRLNCSNTDEKLVGLVMPCREDVRSMDPPDPFKVWK